MCKENWLTERISPLVAILTMAVTLGGLSHLCMPKTRYHTFVLFTPKYRVHVTVISTDKMLTLEVKRGVVSRPWKRVVRR